MCSVLDGFDEENYDEIEAGFNDSNVNTEA